MRSAAAALVLSLLVARTASAQVWTGGQVPTHPPPQLDPSMQANVQTSVMLQLYMVQMAGAGRPPTQSDIDEATRQYFTNGAAATGVPTSGPGAAYFRNGAAVLAATPTIGPPATATAAPTAAPVEAEAGTQAATATPEAAAPTPAPAPAGVPLPADLDSGAAEASAAPSQAESTAAGPGAPTASPPPAVGPASTIGPGLAWQQRAASPTIPAIGAADSEGALACPPSPSLFARIAQVLGGVLFGGFAVLLWSRPRAYRAVQRR